MFVVSLNYMNNAYHFYFRTFVILNTIAVILDTVSVAIVTVGVFKHLYFHSAYIYASYRKLAVHQDSF